jgi:hypothetical protein
MYSQNGPVGDVADESDVLLLVAVVLIPAY